MKKKFNSQNFVFDRSKHAEPISDKPSEAIPDMGISVKEIIVKYANGTIGPISKPIMYDLENADVDPDDHIDPTQDPAFDLSDVQRIKSEIDENASARKKAEAERVAKAKRKSKTEKGEGQEGGTTEKPDPDEVLEN